MHVGIDVTAIAYGRGVSRYTSNLVRGLLAENTTVSAYASSMRLKDTLRAEMTDFRGLKRKVIDPYPPTLLATMWRFNRNKIHSKLPGIEVFHSWDWLQPPDTTFPLVSTIHDLAILKYPETAHPKIIERHQRSWEILKERHAHIITPSQSSKKDVVELLQFPKKRVHVVYEALPLETQTAADNLSDERYEAIKRRLELKKPYVLFVGTREPRKNLENLIKAWKPLRKDLDLLIVGAKGWDETSKSDSPAQAGRPKWQQEVRFTGRVSDQELAVLYQEAEVFAYPSLDEGFGLPILEAFYHGTPVVTSNRSAMPEVAGNAAELVDPGEPESIQKGIETILNESDRDQDQRRRKMILRLQLFNWQQVARETKSVYSQAIREFNA